LWRLGQDGELAPNGFHRHFLSIAQSDTFDKFFVAHGVGLSMGTSDRNDASRRRRWLERMQADQRAFGFRWYTEHLGASSLAGMAMTLPIPVPMDAAAAKVLRGRLKSMQQVVPDVGVENNVAYFTLGAPLEEPGFLRRVLSAPRTHLLLDLHNLHTMAVNFGFDPETYLAALPLDRVIEMHVSGGSFSDGAWLPSGRIMRLDSHSGAVPDEVWRLLALAVPRCPNLRGVTLERMEGTVGPDDMGALHEELRRIRKVVA